MSGLWTAMTDALTSFAGGIGEGVRGMFTALLYEDAVAGTFSDFALFAFGMIGIGLGVWLLRKFFKVLRLG